MTFIEPDVSATRSELPSQKYAAWSVVFIQRNARNECHERSWRKGPNFPCVAFYGTKDIVGWTKNAGHETARNEIAGQNSYRM